MYDAISGAPVRQNMDQLSIVQGALTFKLGQQAYANSCLGRLNENGEVTCRDLWLDRDRRLLPPWA